jgi:hypothetical protein
VAEIRLLHLQLFANSCFCSLLCNRQHPNYYFSGPNSEMHCPEVPSEITAKTLFMSHMCCVGLHYCTKGLHLAVDLSGINELYLTL